MLSVNEARTQMEKAVEAMRREFSSVRTGKASPALLDTVRVDAYGSKMPINQVGTVSAAPREPQQTLRRYVACRTPAPACQPMRPLHPSCILRS